MGGDVAQDKDPIHRPWNFVAVANKAVHPIAHGGEVGDGTVSPKPILKKRHGLALGSEQLQALAPAWQEVVRGRGEVHQGGIKLQSGGEETKTAASCRHKAMGGRASEL